MNSTLLSVFGWSLLTAVFTGLGALPFLFIQDVKPRTIAIANAVAAGMMLAASFSLIFEGLTYSSLNVLLGVILGLIFIMGSKRWLEESEDVELAGLRQADARKSLLIIGVMTLHSVAEGVGVGVSFGDGIKFGIFIALAIAIHNIPEGLAISLVSVPRGMPVWKAAAYSILSSMPQPIMAVIAFLFVEQFFPFLPVGLGFAAGAMIWMVFSEIVPETFEDASPSTVGVTITLAAAGMIAFQVLIEAVQ